MFHPNGMCAVVECLSDDGRWQTIQEHGAVQPDPYSYSSYIESYIGRHFRIKYLPPANAYNSGYDFAVSVFVDGRRIEGTVFARHNMSGGWGIVEGMRVGPTHILPFTFGKVRLSRRARNDWTGLILPMSRSWLLQTTMT